MGSREFYEEMGAGRAAEADLGGGGAGPDERGGGRDGPCVVAAGRAVSPQRGGCASAPRSARARGKYALAGSERALL